MFDDFVTEIQSDELASVYGYSCTEDPSWDWMFEEE